MRSALRARFPSLLPGVTWEYFIIENPFLPYRALSSSEIPETELKQNYGGRQVTRQEAREYVKENGLKLVYKTEDGEIYDHPEHPVRDEFRLFSLAKVKRVEEVWD